MSSGDKSPGMKSAYDLALERLQDQGIEPPRKEGLAPETQAQIAEIRQKAEARIAQLEILLRDRLRATRDPAERAAAEQEYRVERQRLESNRDRDIQQIRATGRPDHNLG